MAPIINISEEGLALIDLLRHPSIKYTRVQPIQVQPISSQSSRYLKIPKSQKSKKSQYILLDREHQNGNYSKVDLLVPFKRTHFYENWTNCNTPTLLANELGYMPTIRQHLDFLELIKSGEAFDENGDKIDSKKLQTLFNSITKKRHPWRGELLDAKFTDHSIIYHSIEKDGTVKKINESLGDCLIEDKHPGISLDSWLKTANSHGMPTENTQDGNLDYLFPRKGKIAWFGADSDGAFFYCERDNLDQDNSLGVRVTRKK